MHSRRPFLFFSYVAKATTEMERSGIEVRVAQCGRSREAYMAKATTDTLNTWRGFAEPSEKARIADGAERNRGTRCLMRTYLPAVKRQPPE